MDQVLARAPRRLPESARMPRVRPDRPNLKLTRGVWYIVWWDGNARRSLSTGSPNPTRARQSLADFEASLERRPAALTVGEALARYTDGRQGKVMAHDRMTQAAKVLRAGMGDLRVDQVRQSIWDAYAAERVTKAKPRQVAHKPQPVAAGTLRREFVVLRAALRRAWKDGFLVRPPEIEPPPDSQPRDRYLTKQEAKALLDNAAGHVRTFTALALFTGARRGSILTLTWDRVDFDRGVVDFQEPGRTLTKKRRSIVPMTGQLRTALQQAAQDRAPDCAYVVQWQGRPVPHGLRWSFAKLCTAAGLTWKPTPHHMKHSVASFMAMDGVPIDQAADWLATDPATLRRTYRKFDPTYLRSVASSLDL